MHRAFAGWVMLGLPLLLAGCSSLNNIGVGPGGPSAGSCALFGGVAESTGRIADGVDSLQRGGLQFYLPVVTECMLVCTLADVPLSCVGDVITLPYCLYRVSHPLPVPPPSPAQELVYPGWMQGPVPVQSSSQQPEGHAAASPQPLPPNGRMP